MSRVQILTYWLREDVQMSRLLKFLWTSSRNGFGGEGGKPVGEVAGDPGKVLGPPIVSPVPQEDQREQKQKQQLDNNDTFIKGCSDERNITILASQVYVNQSSIGNIVAKNITTVRQHWSKLLKGKYKCISVNEQFKYLVKPYELFNCVACALNRVADQPQLRPEPHDQQPVGEGGDMVVAEDEAVRGRGQEGLEVRSNVSNFVS